ncbi:hypothetical protein CLOP_g6510 [Closterium sp. NIES-67]|nr:hypothetical protein CLOP_g6510 [Closterium sp. NIES-67]
MCTRRTSDRANQTQQSPQSFANVVGDSPRVSVKCLGTLGTRTNDIDITARPSASRELTEFVSACIEDT